jgi:translation initiation factor IF-3
LFGQLDRTSRTFASRRRGGPKGKKSQKSSNFVANEELVSQLIRNAGESSADDVTVRLVIDEGQDAPSSIQIISLSEAIVQSLNRELDLIGANINGDPPVIRATELSKLEYKHQQAQKKQQQSAANKKEKKSFRFKAGIEANDLERKLDRLKGFLSKGHDCEFTVFTRMRTLRVNPNAGAELVDQIRELLSEHGDMKRPPQPNETKSFYRVQYEPKR